MSALSRVFCVARPAKPFTNIDQEAPVVKGEIETNESILVGYTVQLYDINRHSTLSTSDIRSDGEFEFRQTPYGSYLVTVTNPRGESVYQGNVNVGGPPTPFVIRLAKEERERPVSGTISLKQL